MTIAVESLTVEYVRERPVVRDVTVTSVSGTITAVVGPNGSGKTTLLRTMAGLISPTRGRIAIDDKSVVDIEPRERARRIAFVSHRPQMDAPFTSREVVALGCFAHREHQRERVHDAMQRCEVDGLGDELFQTLSAGQQQRVSLARAVAQLGPHPDGRLLIMDEPTSAMDPMHVMSVMNLVRDLASRGVTIIMSVHDLGMACRFADNAWVLDKGRLTASGPVAETLNDATLTRVFGVPFEWTRLAEGTQVPIAMAGSTDATRRSSDA